jgi:hypothetical protein
MSGWIDGVLVALAVVGAALYLVARGRAAGKKSGCGGGCGCAAKPGAAPRDPADRG